MRSEVPDVLRKFLKVIKKQTVEKRGSVGSEKRSFSLLEVSHLVCRSCTDSVTEFA